MYSLNTPFLKMTHQELDCSFQVQVSLPRIYRGEKFLPGVGDGGRKQGMSDWRWPCLKATLHPPRTHFSSSSLQGTVLFNSLQHMLLGTNLVLTLLISWNSESRESRSLLTLCSTEWFLNTTSPLSERTQLRSPFIASKAFKPRFSFK